MFHGLIAFLHWSLTWVAKPKHLVTLSEATLLEHRVSASTF